MTLALFFLRFFLRRSSDSAGGWCIEWPCDCASVNGGGSCTAWTRSPGSDKTAMCAVDVAVLLAAGSSCRVAGVR
jgi:hypothetical protein